jgi:phosphoribosylglycinamide formyltransferase-1
VLRVAVLASGKGSNLEALLTRIQTGHVDAAVSLVLSDRPEAGALDVARRGHVRSIVSLPPQQAEKKAQYDERVLAVLQADSPDLVVLAGYMRIAGPRLLEAYAGRMVNIHPALLPDFRGLHAVRQALAAGVARAGCTTHLVTNDLDGGPLILHASLRVRPAEDERVLQQRILRLEHLVLPRTVQLFAEGRIKLDGAPPGRVRILPGPSWLTRQDLPLVSGAEYGEGF